MTVIGNILLLLATLIYATLINMLYFKNTPRGGDYVVGYAWCILILNAAFIIVVLITYSLIAFKGGFSWIGQSGSSRFFIVAGGLLSILITNALSGLFKNEYGHTSAFLRSFSNIIPIILPVTLIVIGFVLINKINTSAAFLKWPVIIIGIIGIIGIICFLGAYLSQQSANAKATIQADAEFEDKNRKNSLQYIDTCNVMKDMVFLLVYTDDNQYPDVREKALAKIKTNPEWQQELIRRLQNDWAPEAFTYLASNTVDSVELFTTPLKKGILIQAKLIRESIRKSSHPSHFYHRLFSWEVEKVLRTVDKFKTPNENYLSEVKQLRAALDEPSEFEKPLFACIPLLDKWIKQHQ